MGKVVGLDGKEVNPPQARKIFLMFEDTGNNTFQFYMGGDTDRLAKGEVSKEEMTPSELWGSSVFQLSLKMLQEAGVIKQAINNGAMKQS